MITACHQGEGAKGTEKKRIKVGKKVEEPVLAPA
jgi:hypothetical protein